MTTTDTDASSTALEEVITSTDPVTLAKVWGMGGMTAVLVGLVAGLLVSLERLDLDGAGVFGSADEVFQFWSVHRVALVLLGVLPVLIALGTTIVPRQCGANTLLFPRAAALSCWTWLIGAGMTVVGFLVDGGLGTPGGGGQRQATALTLMGLLLVIGGLLVATMCILSTILSGRAAGIGLGDLPFLSWTTLVAGTVWLGMLPVLAANAVLAYVDLRGRPAVRFGAEDAIWEQLSWMFTHPAIYILALPVLGIALDVISSATGTETANRGVLLVATAAFGFLSFGAYAQSFFDTPGTPIMEEAIYVLNAFAIIPIALAILGGVADLLRRGRSNLGSKPPAPVVLLLLAVLLVVAGTVLGAIRVVAPWDLLGTSVTGAQFTLIVGAAIIGTVAGLNHWGEDLLGSPGSPGLILLGGLAATLGVALIGVADAISGFGGQADFTGVDLATAGYPGSGVGALNAVALLGAVAFLAAGLIWMFAGVTHLMADTKAEVA